MASRLVAETEIENDADVATGMSLSSQEYINMKKINKSIDILNLSNSQQALFLPIKVLKNKQLI